jgi:hypothetical protein
MLPYYVPGVPRYASPAFSSVSSSVSTPAMTPPLVSVLDGMLAHQPSWMGMSQEMIVAKISELQAQTAHLVSLLKHSQQPPPQSYFPSFVAPPSPACPTPGVPSSSGNEAFLAAQAVFASVPRGNYMDENVLARAVVAAANALLGTKTGYIADLRQPEALRAQTPAWISQAANAGAEDSALTCLVKAESPAPEFGSLDLKSPTTVTKCARQMEYKE